VELPPGEVARETFEVEPQSPGNESPLKPGPSFVVQTKSPASRSQERSETTAALVLGSVAVAAIAGGIGAAVVAKQDSDELTRNDQRDLPFDPAVDHQGRIAQTAAIALLSVGGAASISGLVTFLMAKHHARRSRLVR
jgi:hypothetical protein